MGQASMISSIVETGMNIHQNIINGIIQYQSAQYNAAAIEAQAAAQQQILNYNAQIEQQEADYAEDLAHEKERRQRNENQRFISMQRALYGASGVALTSGSPLAVLGETAANLEMTSMEILRQGQMERNRHLMQKESYLYQGRVVDSNADAASNLEKYYGGLSLGMALAFAPSKNVSSLLSSISGNRSFNSSTTQGGSSFSTSESGGGSFSGASWGGEGVPSGGGGSFSGASWGGEGVPSGGGGSWGW